jgi:hypothetical protein
MYVEIAERIGVFVEVWAECEAFSELLVVDCHEQV